MGLGPVPAVRKVMAATGMTIDESGVAIPGGDTLFSVPGALGSEVAVHIRRSEP